VPQAAIDKHLSVIGNPPAMEAALAWYRARGERQPIGPIKVPTLFIWGDADDTVGRISAEGTSEFIAADYRFAALPGVGHYAAHQVPAQVNVAAGAPRLPPSLSDPIGRLRRLWRRSCRREASRAWRLTASTIL
jgi:pimeloyl-ACP methyl ester carboxylesterase